jgi:hypothetical protein
MENWKSLKSAVGKGLLYLEDSRKIWKCQIPASASGIG